MPVGTSNGEYYETDFDHEHAMMFGGRPGVYNPKTDTWEAAPAEDEKKDNKLFLVRHGDTQLNEEDRVHGWTTQPLNEKGVQQSQKAAESLSNKNITNIVSSDLPRAKQTANIISRETGAPITINPNLRTWDTGYLDGSDAKEAHDLVKKHPVDNPDTPLPGGSESFNEFKDRVISAVSDVRKNADGNTVIVSHSKPIGVIDGWEKNGFSKDGYVHMDTYEDSRCRPTTGGHQELDLPQQAAEVAAKRMKGAVLHGADQPSDIALGHGVETLAKRWDVSNIANIPSELRDEWMKDKSWGHSDFITKYLTPTGGELGGGLIGMFGGARGAAKGGSGIMKDLAQNMENLKSSAQDIFKKTGWYRDVDKHWKEVIPTHDVKLIKDHFTEESPGKFTVNNINKTRQPKDPFEQIPFGADDVQLQDIYHNPDFYARYPEARNIPIKEGGVGEGSWNGKEITLKGGRSEKDILDTLHHELQHYIQDVEGFPTGGSQFMSYPQADRYLALLDKLKEHRKNFEDQIRERLNDPAFDDSGIVSKKLAYYAIENADEIQNMNMSQSVKNSILFGSEWKDVKKFFDMNPDMLEAGRRHKWFDKAINEERISPYELYKSIYGEVEARNAEKWASMTPEMQRFYQELGVSPRSTAQSDVPENKRIFSPAGKQSFSESDLSGSVNRMRSEGRTWREISKELDIPLNKLYRAFRDDANYTTGKRYVPPTEGAPMKWTKEYGYPGSSKWQKAFGRLENKNTPRNKSLDTMTDEEKLRYIMQNK